MKRILETLKIKWPEYLLEILVLIIGIYGAFAMDNWKEEQNKIEKERIIIKELHKEFENNRAQFLEVKNQHLLGHVSAKWLYERIPFDESISKDSVMLHLRNLYNAWTFNPSQSNITALINTSSFDIIRNSELRKMLVRWNDALIDYQEEELYAVNYRNKLADYLQNKIDLQQVFEGEGTFDYFAINNLETKNFIYLRYITLSNLVGSEGKEAKEIEQMMDEIIERTSEMK